MGQDISHDIIATVQTLVHHYETRCALRLVCRKFAAHILIFDERALPIFSTASYAGSQTDGGVRWKGRHTYSAYSAGGSLYVRLCFRQSLQYFAVNDFVKELVFRQPAHESYLRFFASRTGSFPTVFGKIIRTIRKNSSARIWDTDVQLFSNQPESDWHGIAEHDLIRFHRIRVNESDMGLYLRHRIYMEYHDYCRMMHELEYLARLRAEFPGNIHAYNLEADFERRQKKLKILP